MLDLVPDQIKRVKRRSIALIINRDGEFIVRSPINAKESEIWAFINAKKEWIIRKKQEMLASIENNKIQLDNQKRINILGKELIISLDDCKIAKIKEDVLVLPKTNTQSTLISLLKRELKKHLNLRVQELASRFDFKFKSVSITSATTCWGSCGGGNSLNFTYKLALCPLPVIDYIIIHELCHTKVKNHSTQFWAEVGKIYPEYKHCEKWLKQNRAIINSI